MGDFPQAPTLKVMNLFSITFLAMKDEHPQITSDRESLNKEEQENLKNFFVLLYRIDCRLKGEEGEHESNEDYQTRNQSNQT